MVYNIKEYKCKFDTPMKMQQEKVVVNKIMDLLNKNKYDNIDELIEKNSNYQNFLKNNNLDIVVKHFGNTLNEEDYVQILDNFKELNKNKNDFDKENIKTTNIEDKEYNTYAGKDRSYYFDNSNSDKSIEEQMKDMQHTQEQFQTADKKENTENMMRELNATKKQSLNLEYVDEVYEDILNREEKELYQVAKSIQESTDGRLRIDFEREIIVDELDNIKKIEKKNGEFVVKSDETGEEEKVEVNEEEKVNQKTLTKSLNTIYSNTIQ